jgi:hypothetical protein
MATVSDDGYCETLTEGEHQVASYLQAVGVPDFGIAAYLDLDGRNGRWPHGIMLEETSTAELVATVTLGLDGVYRVERGPAELFWELMNQPGDEDDV